VNDFTEPFLPFPFIPDEMKQETSQNICQHFLLGRCHFGDRCRLSHRSVNLSGW